MAQDVEKTVDQLNEEADIAADYLEGLLDIADYDGDIEMSVRNNRAMLQIVADDDADIKHLIGDNGQVVDALQQLTRLAVQQKTGERSHLILDVDGFLKRRRQLLQDMALDAIDDVKDTGEPVNLKPMNSFERKVIHDLVREEGLKSRSHGEEPHRYVSIYLKANSDDDVQEDSHDSDTHGPDDVEVAAAAAHHDDVNDTDGGEEDVERDNSEKESDSSDYE